jgi:hypothetical protein
VKNLLTGFVCMGLALALPAAGRAQQQAPPETQAAPNAPQQTPPPDEETPKPVPGRIELPPLPKVVDVRMPGERGISYGIFGWYGKAKVGSAPGAAVAVDNPGSIYAQHAAKPGENFEIAIAAGAHNVLRITASNLRSTGSSTTGSAMALWTAAYKKGDYIATDYRLRDMKISYEYLSWPFPVKDRRIRVRSLWQVQYIGVKTGYNAPLEPVFDSDGNQILDDSGNPVQYQTSGSKWIILPGIGLGVQGYITPRFSLEVSGSGFDIPHHTNFWDAEAAANIRFGHYEVRLGARGFHFRTSPKAEFWMRGTVFGPMVGLRWHSDSDRP